MNSKELPQKPIKDNFYGKICTACPRCYFDLDKWKVRNLFTDEIIKPRYCPECGQSLDWSKKA